MLAPSMRRTSNTPWMIVTLRTFKTGLIAMVTLKSAEVLIGLRRLVSSCMGLGSDLVATVSSWLDIELRGVHKKAGQGGYNVPGGGKE